MNTTADEIIDPIADVRARLTRAQKTLIDMVAAHRTLAEKVRLKGKIEGVRLAISYIDEVTR